MHSGGGSESWLVACVGHPPMLPHAKAEMQGSVQSGGGSESWAADAEPHALTCGLIAPCMHGGGFPCFLPPMHARWGICLSLLPMHAW